MSAAGTIGIEEAVWLSEQLQAGRDRMPDPQDLPGRFGRAVHAVDHVLAAIGCEAVLAGGWAVWRHGYAARVTQDLDVALPRDKIEEFLRAAAVAGFQVLHVPPGRWPKVVHKETGIGVDILPEGERPGVAPNWGPVTIRHPREMGGIKASLRYADFFSLLELKLAAGRLRDEDDVAELIRAQPDQIEAARQHLGRVHPELLRRFNALVERALQEGPER